MGPEFRAADGAEGWQLSNPSILSMAPLRASLEIFDEAGIERLRAKSTSLTAYLEFLLNQDASGKFRVITPTEPQWRGAQLSVRMREGGRNIVDRLSRQGVLCDWREPDILRVAPVPLYNSFTDVFQFAARLFCAIA
jgi:kynureninase